MRNLKWLLIASMILVGCQDKKSITLIVDAVTNKQDPVAGAQILLNDEVLGQTNAAGKATIATDLKVGQRYKLEISKNSSEYYFAPYFDNVLVKKEGPLTRKINAILFYVPKPGVSDEKDIVAKKEKEGVKDSGKDVSEVVSAVKEKSKAKKTAKDSQLIHENKPDTVLANIKTNKNKASIKAMPIRVTPSNEKPSSDSPIVEPKEFSIRVYAKSNGKPLVSTRVSYQYADSSDVSQGCITNKRGRCTLKLVDPRDVPLTFISEKKGFFTKTRVLRVSKSQKLHFNMPKGYSLDVRALSKSYNQSFGVPGIGVSVNGKKVGVTDKFGRLVYLLDANKDDLVTVALLSEHHYPAKYETDFVVNGDMNLERFFVTKKPAKLRIALLKAQPKGDLDPSQIDLFDGRFDNAIKEATRKSFVENSAFKYVNYSVLSNYLAKSKKSLISLRKNGWQDSKLKSSIDALIIPTVDLGKNKSLEFSLIDSRGETITAAKTSIALDSRKHNYESAISSLRDSILQSFPFEGAVVSIEGKTINVNLTNQNGRNIRSGTTLDIYGDKLGKLGKSISRQLIGYARVIKVGPKSSIAKIVKLEPRAKVTVGDRVVVSRDKAISFSVPTLVVKTQNTDGTTSFIDRANVYINGKWAGSTSSTGRIKLSHLNLKRTDRLEISKFGYKSFNKVLSLNKKKTVNISLVRESAFVNISSEPAGAKIHLDGKYVGLTPLATPIPVKSGFVKVELMKSGGYKAFSKVYDLSEGALDLTGANKIKLESDHRMLARKLVESGKVNAAVDRLLKVAKSHSDYLFARHEAGELYLAALNEPAEAAAQFSIVTSSPEVKSFQDKRFIGSHINEGIALQVAGERLAKTDKTGSAAHFRKAVEVLSKVQPYLRHVQSGEYDLAFSKLSFYKSMALYRLWELNKTSATKQAASRSFKTYLSHSVDSKNEEVSRLISDARIFQRKLMAQ